MKSWGGLERKFTILCEEFLRQGVTPEIICIRGGVAPYPDSLSAGVRVVDLRTRSKLDGIPRVARYLRQRRPDALLTAKDHAAQVAILARALSGVKIPVFIKTTNMPSEVIRRPVQRFMARRLYRRADGVIAISQGVADDVVRNFNVPPERVSLIYNPALTRDFPARLAAPVDHPWLDDSEDIPVIIGAGRLTRQKDFITLIEAFAQLHGRRRCRLIILGEGVERPALEARARALGVSEDFALPGAVADPVPWMHAADLFAFSSRYEGLGNALIEALAAGTRLVSTDCPSGPREILCDGRHGRLVPVEDPPALAMAMGAVLDEPRPQQAQIREATRRFEAEVVAGQYLQLLGLAHEA